MMYFKNNLDKFLPLAHINSSKIWKKLLAHRVLGFRYLASANFDFWYKCTVLHTGNECIDDLGSFDEPS